MYTVWSKEGADIYYRPETGYFDASAPGWWGPDDFMLVGVYALVNPDKSFDDFSEEIISRVRPEDRKKIKKRPTETDIYWVYLGNHNYHELTGKHGSESPWDYLILEEEEEREEFYIGWNSKKMEKEIDKILRKLRKGKDQEELAEDFKQKHEWFHVFADEIMASDVLYRDKF